MATNVNTIFSGNWSMSLAGFGEVVTGINEINQTIYLILNTRKGSDPFRPLFGSDIWDYIDQPIPTAAPGMVRAIVESIGRWEPRVNVLSVTYSVIGQEISPTVPAGLAFTITWELIGGEQIETIDLLIGYTSTGEATIVVLGTEDGAAVLTENQNYITI